DYIDRRSNWKVPHGRADEHGHRGRDAAALADPRKKDFESVMAESGPTKSSGSIDVRETYERRRAEGRRAWGRWADCGRRLSRARSGVFAGGCGRARRALPGRPGGGGLAGHDRWPPRVTGRGARADPATGGAGATGGRLLR